MRFAKRALDKVGSRHVKDPEAPPPRKLAFKMAPPPRPPRAAVEPARALQGGGGGARARRLDGCAPARERAASARAAGAGSSERRAAAAEPDVSAKMAGRVSTVRGAAVRGGGAWLTGNWRSRQPQGRGMSLSKRGGEGGWQAREAGKRERWQGISPPQKLRPR